MTGRCDPIEATAGRLLVIAGLCFAVLLHAVIVYEIATRERPFIWSLHNDTIHRLGPGADFYALYHAAINRERGLSPYATDPDGVTPYFYGFRYLPIVADGARALRLFAPRTAHRIWILVLEGFLGVLAWFFWRRIPDIRLRLFAVAALLVCSPYFLELYMGQFTFAAVGLFALGLLARGGVITYTGSVMLKVFPLAAAPAMLRHRRTLLALGVAAGVTLVLSVPYFLLHPEDWQAFYVLNARSEGGMHSGNFGFMYLLYLVVRDAGLAGLAAHWTGVVGVLRPLILGGTAVVVLLSRDDRIVPGAVTMLLAHFVSYPHVWEHHASGIVILALLLLTIEHRRRWELPVIVISLIHLVGPTPYMLFDVARDPRIWDPAVDWPWYASYLVLFPKVAATVALFALCLHGLWRAGLYSVGEFAGKYLVRRPADRAAAQ